MALGVVAQRAQKRVTVVQHFEARGVAIPTPEWDPSGSSFGYRNRLRLRVVSDGQVAFFNEHKAPSCVVLEPELAALVVWLRALSGERPDLFAPFAHLEVRAPDADGRPGICLYAANKPPAASAEALRAELRAQKPQLLVGVSGHDVANAMPRQRVLIAGDTYARVPVDAFLQVNSAVNRSLVKTLRDLAREHRVESFADVYAGAGNLSLALLRDGLDGFVSEAQASAVHAFQSSCAEQGFSRVRSSEGSAEHAASRCREEARSFDLLILDAPRAGVKSGLTELARLATRHVAVCSCNPETLARDVELLAGLGFSVVRVVLFDMFPHTKHVEVLAWLTRALLDPSS